MATAEKYCSETWVDAEVVGASARILEQVEALPPDATGALRFGNSGVVLVEARQICWAAASGMQTLTERLRNLHDPPIDRERLEAVFRNCQERKIPLGEALLASGAVTADELRQALLVQTTEAIARLARTDLATGEFVTHTHSRYDARFVFSSAEILASVGACSEPLLAREAAAHLNRALVGGSGFAYIDGSQRGTPTVLAVVNLTKVGVAELVGVSRWASARLDVGRLVEAGAKMIAASWRGRGAVVGWRRQGVAYAALCPHHAASACLIARLEPELRDDES